MNSEIPNIGAYFQKYDFVINNVTFWRARNLKHDYILQSMKKL